MLKEQLQNLRDQMQNDSSDLQGKMKQRENEFEEQIRQLNQRHNFEMKLIEEKNSSMLT